MKRIILSLAGLLTFGGMIAQPVADNAIIPVSVTLNSILRLNVTSGGNIEFVVNTLQQYEDGVRNIARYTTTFTVASSIDYDVNIQSENATLNSNTSANTIALNNLGYTVESKGSAVVGTDFDLCGAAANPSTVQAITNAPFRIVHSNPGAGAGDATKNKFEIQWRFGTKETNMNSNSLLQQSIAADRYSTNVFLVLGPRQ